MHAKGTFVITMNAEPPFDVLEGVALGRATLEKRFTGALAGASTVHMTSVRTPVDGSAGYLAVERVIGTLDGREGTFVLMHIGTMDHGTQTLWSVVVVPDSGTGALRGIRGAMTIEIRDGQHFYDLDYELPR